MNRRRSGDSIDCGVASGDMLLTFRRAGTNPVPVAHPQGLYDYAGERVPPADLLSELSRLGWQADGEPLVALDLAAIRRLHVG